MLLAVQDGPLINLINTPLVDDHAHKLLTVEVVMVSFCSLLLHFFLIHGVALSEAAATDLFINLHTALWVKKAPARFVHP